MANRCLAWSLTCPRSLRKPRPAICARERGKQRSQRKAKPPMVVVPVSGYREAPALNELTLLPGQACFFQDQSKYVAAVTGIGGGKTLTGCAKAIVRYHATPGSLNLIAAPTYSMLRDTVQRTFFELLPPSWIRSWNKNEQHLTRKNGAEVLFRPAFKYEYLRGPTLASAYVDEAALISAEAWKI